MVLRIPSTQTIRKRKKQPVTEKAERTEETCHKMTAKKSPYPLDKSQQRCYTNFINR